MNEELLERGVTSVVTRRTIVKTGAKLAYAAPLVAVTMKVSGSSAFAASPTPEPRGVQCWHSIGAGKPAGCMEACAAAGCPGNQCDGFNSDGNPDPTPGPCEIHCHGAGNICDSDKLCNPACFVCNAAAGAADFVC